MPASSDTRKPASSPISEGTPMPDGNIPSSQPESNNSLPAEFSEVASICTATEVIIGGQVVLGIADARDLHRGLKVGKVYASWIKDRINQYGFSQGVDFVSFSQNREKPQGGAPSLVYTITLDMAKELAMVERSQIGQLVRRYFIWCEKQLAARMAQAAPTSAFPIPKDFGEALLLAADQFYKIKQQEETISRATKAIGKLYGEYSEVKEKLTEAEPKADAHDRLSTCLGNMSFRDAAKQLKIRPKDLAEWLITNKYVYRDLRSKKLAAYQEKINNGLLEHRTVTINPQAGIGARIAYQIRITPAGLAHISLKLGKRT